MTAGGMADNVIGVIARSGSTCTPATVASVLDRGVVPPPASVQPTSTSAVEVASENAGHSIVTSPVAMLICHWYVLGATVGVPPTISTPSNVTYSTPPLSSVLIFPLPASVGFWSAQVYQASPLTDAMLASVGVDDAP